MVAKVNSQAAPFASTVRTIVKVLSWCDSVKKILQFLTASVVLGGAPLAQRCLSDPGADSPSLIMHEKCFREHILGKDAYEHTHSETSKNKRRYHYLIQCYFSISKSQNSLLQTLRL